MSPATWQLVLCLHKSIQTIFFFLRKCCNYRKLAAGMNTFEGKGLELNQVLHRRERAQTPVGGRSMQTANPKTQCLFSTTHRSTWWRRFTIFHEHMRLCYYSVPFNYQRSPAHIWLACSVYRVHARLISFSPLIRHVSPVWRNSFHLSCTRSAPSDQQSLDLNHKSNILFTTLSTLVPRHTSHVIFHKGSIEYAFYIHRCVHWK